MQVCVGAMCNKDKQKLIEVITVIYRGKHHFMSKLPICRFIISNDHAR